MQRLPVSTITERIISFFAGREIPAGEPCQCMLGRNGMLPEGKRCETIVPGFSGVRDGRDVFCSVEHANEQSYDTAI